MQQADDVETAAIALGQRFEARVRHLEELLSTYQRERDEARAECLLLRERLARASNCNSVGGNGGHSTSTASEDKPLQLHQQQQPDQQQRHLSSSNLQRSSFPALAGRKTPSLERITPSLHLELYAKTKELGDFSQQQQQLQQLHQPKHGHQHQQQLHQPQEQGNVHQGNVHHQQPRQEYSSNSQSSNGTSVPMSPTWTQHNLHLQEPSAADAHLHLPEPSAADAHLTQGVPVPSSFDSCSNFHLPSFSPTTPPVSSGEMLAGLPAGGAFVAESVSSSSLLHRQRPVHLPEPPESDIQVMLNSLPERGQLLQAVMQAGPLLQALMLAGPLPQWRHPPPAVASVEIPKVAMPSGGSSMDKSKNSGSLSTSFGKSG